MVHHFFANGSSRQVSIWTSQSIQISSTKRDCAHSSPWSCVHLGAKLTLQANNYQRRLHASLQKIHAWLTSWHLILHYHDRGCYPLTVKPPPSRPRLGHFTPGHTRALSSRVCLRMWYLLPMCSHLDRKIMMSLGKWWLTIGVLLCFPRNFLTNPNIILLLLYNIYIYIYVAH